MPARPAEPSKAEPEVAYKDPNELEQLAREGKLTSEELLAQVKLGFDSLDRGDSIELRSREDIDKLFAEIRAEIAPKRGMKLPE